MLERIVELQRMVCNALDNIGKEWYEIRTAHTVEEGRLVTKRSYLDSLVEALSQSDGWESVPIWMTTDDTSENLLMNTSYPVIDDEIACNEEIVVLSKMELYALLGSVSSEAVQPSAKVTEVAKPRPRKLEFI